MPVILDSLFHPYSVVQYKRTNFTTTRADSQLLNKPFKLLTAIAQNNNALEHCTIVGTYSLL